MVSAREENGPCCAAPDPHPGGQRAPAHVQPSLTQRVPSLVRSYAVTRWHRTPSTPGRRAATSPRSGGHGAPRNPRRRAGRCATYRPSPPTATAALPPRLVTPSRVQANAPSPALPDDEGTVVGDAVGVAVGKPLEAGRVPRPRRGSRTARTSPLPPLEDRLVMPRRYARIAPPPVRSGWSGKFVDFRDLVGPGLHSVRVLLGYPPHDRPHPTSSPTTRVVRLLASRVEAGFLPADDHVERSLDLNEELIPRPAATFFLRAGAPRCSARASRRRPPGGRSRPRRGPGPGRGGGGRRGVHREALTRTPCARPLTAEHPGYPRTSAVPRPSPIWGWFVR